MSWLAQQCRACEPEACSWQSTSAASGAASNSCLDSQRFKQANQPHTLTCRHMHPLFGHAPTAAAAAGKLAGLDKKLSRSLDAEVAQITDSSTSPLELSRSPVGPLTDPARWARAWTVSPEQTGQNRRQRGWLGCTRQRCRLTAATGSRLGAEAPVAMAGTRAVCLHQARQQQGMAGKGKQTHIVIISGYRGCHHHL